MKRFKWFLYILLIISAAVASAIACDSKGELTASATYPLKKDECHEFTLKAESAKVYQLTAQQIGVDIDLRLFEDDTEIKSADSENLNSGFEFLPFISKPNATYKLRINWLDDNKILIKNEGFYKLELETRTTNSGDESFIRNLETGKLLYEKATSERLAKNQNAAADFTSAITIYKSLPETKLTKYKLFLTKYHLAISYISLRKYAEAIPVLEENYASAAENQDKYIENLTLKALGTAYFKTGNFTRSREVLENAVSGFEKSAAEKVGEIQNLPSTYNSLAETLLSLNKTEQALAILENVRANFKQSVYENTMATLKLADIYFDFGDLKKSEAILSSISVPDNANDYVKGVFSKVSGKIYMKSDKEKALNLFAKATAYFAGNDEELASTSMFIGNTYYYTKDYNSAKTYYEQSKPVFEAQNDDYNSAQILNNIAVIYYSRKDYQAAISNCESALALNIELQNELNTARNLINLMYFYEAAGNIPSAIFYGKWAINTIQNIKYQQLQNLEKELQSNFQDSFNDAFRKLANLLVNESRISEAEQILRFIKEKEYQDYVRGSGKLNGVDYTKAEEELLKEAKVKTGKKSSALPKVFGDESGTVTDSPAKKLIEKLKLRNVEVSELVFVNTLVTRNNVVVIATSATEQKVYTQNISRENLNKLVFDFREAVTDTNKNPKIGGQKLYEILVKPFEPDFLSSKIKKIVWSLDGVLRYVPIPALFDGKNYLVGRFANIQLNLAENESVLMPKIVEQPAIGMASSKSFEDLSGLPIAKNELDCIFEDDKQLIINSTCKKGIIKGRKVADEDFTQAVFEDALKQYKLIHLTSHFVMQTGDNSKSFLLLGGGKERKYTMQTFSTQKLNNVEVLIMSACNTANFTPDGSEFESFATMAQKQGAKAVIGTLWSVADISTSVFMTEYYRFYEINKLDKAEAIRQAQIFVSKNKKYSHPFYWSPFVLFGNWK
jgi:CHAT domain-containing protein